MAPLLLLQHTLTLDSPAWNHLLPDASMANYFKSIQMSPSQWVSPCQNWNPPPTSLFFPTLYHQTWVTYLPISSYERSMKAMILIVYYSSTYYEYYMTHTRSSLHIWKTINWSLGFCTYIPTLPKGMTIHCNFPSQKYNHMRVNNR